MADELHTVSSNENSDSPLLSVIMATYNRGPFIVSALESLLQQAYSPLEIIIVDDGSTDGTAPLIDELIVREGAPIHYVWQTNAGFPAALNHGLRLARGKIVSFLDSDDLWPKDRLPAQIVLFDTLELPSQVKPEIILGREERFAINGTVDPAELAAANERPFHYSLGASLFARKVFDSVGLFDESLPYCADWDWFSRAREAGIPMASDSRVTLRMRVHGGNLTQNRQLSNLYTARMVRKHLDRIRQPN
jgi:glycosyltransferase involved in cell wall biosynthesis